MSLMCSWCVLRGCLVDRELGLTILRRQQDAVNRRISMKMMVDTAKAANGVQFILITPQDMGVSRDAFRLASLAPELKSRFLRRVTCTVPRFVSASFAIPSVVRLCFSSLCAPFRR